MNAALIEIADRVLLGQEDEGLQAVCEKALDSHNALLFVVTADRTIAFMNAEACRAAGWTRAEGMARRPCSDLPGEMGSLHPLARLEAGENLTYFRINDRNFICSADWLYDMNEKAGALISVVPELESAGQEGREPMLPVSNGNDALTALPMLETFYRKTRRLLDLNPGVLFVMVSWNVSRFKVVNAVFGPKTGDTVLVNIADSIRKLVGSSGTYGRIGGDKFAFCIPEEKLQTSWLDYHSEVTLISDTAIFTFKSNFGIYEIREPDIGVDVMCDRATLARESVNDAHNIAGRPYAFYDENMRRQIIDDQALMSELNYALENGQLRVYYQPVYDIETGVIASAEAVVRWKHPERGMIPPDRFIPLFEKNGLVTRLDQYIWDQAAAFLEQRLKSGKRTVPVSINVSRVDFFTTTLVEDLEDVIQRHRLPHEMLRVEVTESAYADDPGRIVDFAGELQSRGFVLLLDDFGSDYSSLNALKDIPVDIVKLDKQFLSSFETSKRSACIIESVVGMARRLGLKTIAEGVETEREAAFLYSVGCNLAQGFLYSQPVPQHTFEELLEAAPRKVLPPAVAATE